MEDVNNRKRKREDINVDEDEDKDYFFNKLNDALKKKYTKDFLDKVEYLLSNLINFDSFTDRNKKLLFFFFYYLFKVFKFI